MTTINLQVNARLRNGREITGTVESEEVLRIAGAGHHAIHIFDNGSSMPPQGATIDVATLQLYVWDYTDAQFTVQGEDNISPADLNTADSNDISNRSILSETVSVSTTYTDRSWESINITAIIQELVDKGSWTTSSKAAVILDRDGGDFGSRGWFGNNDLAAKLDITYHTTVTTSNFTGSPLSGIYATQVDDISFNNLASTTDPLGFTGGSSAWLWEYRIDAGSWTAFPSGSTDFEPGLDDLAVTGSYSIRLTATSNDGTSDTFTRSGYFVVEAARTASASFTTTGTDFSNTDLVVFTNTSTTDDPGGISSYTYESKLSSDVNYSTLSLLSDPELTFAVGVWDIRLTVVTDVGATDISSVTTLTITRTQISVFRPYGAPGKPPIILDKQPLRPLIPIPSTSGVIVECLIAEPGGRVIAEIQADITSVAWKMSAVSKVQLPLAKTDRKFIERYFQFGNRVFLKFDNNLPDWGGIIDDPETWDQSRMVATASSAEQLLFNRRTLRTAAFSGVKPGVIFSSLINQSTSFYPTAFVKVGEVWGGGGDHERTFHYKTIGKVFTDQLVRGLGADAWDVTPVIESGKAGTRIEFYANLYGRKGADLDNHALEEGGNLIGWKGKRRADRLVNEWVMVGDPPENEDDEWGDSRITAVGRDSESIANHGLIQGFEVRSGVTIQNTLDVTAEKRISETRLPYDELALAVVDRNPAKFSAYGLGDTMPCEIVDFGFNGFQERVRVLAREFFKSDGVCDLVVEVQNA